jgi:hypothetical protein
MLETPTAEAVKMNQKSGIVHSGGTYFASLGGGPGVPIGRELAENISLALRAQKTVDRAVESGRNPKDSRFLEIVSMLNCRQTAFIARNTMTLDSLVEQKRKLKEKLDSSQRKEIQEKASGREEMRKDIDRILELRRLPVYGALDDKAGIRSYLDSHLEDLPAIVHVFDVLPAFTNSLLEKLKR